MPVAILTLELDIPHAQSLKDRRQVVRSLKDTLRRAYNVSVAETDGALVWNRATLQIAAVSTSLRYLAGQLGIVERRATGLAARYGAEVCDSYAELLAESDGNAFDLHERTGLEEIAPDDPRDI